MEETHWKVVAIAGALIALLLVVNLFLTRPVMYTGERGGCLYLVVENPKNGIPERVFCEDAPWLEKATAKKVPLKGH